MIPEINNRETFFQFLKDATNIEPYTIYRGVKKTTYDLKPSIARLNKENGEPMDEDEEDLLFRLFKQKTLPFLKDKYDEMNLLSIAQHHGLPTRILDWTANPLVAAYFAVEKSFEKLEEKTDSIIFVFKGKGNAKVTEQYTSIKVDELKPFIPNYTDQRIINQCGVFTIHPFPWTAYQDEKIERVIVKEEFRRELRHILHKLGINRLTMFPDIDGCCDHIKYLRTDYY
jgi:hypothetical protein